MSCVCFLGTSLSPFFCSKTLTVIFKDALWTEMRVESGFKKNTSFCVVIHLMRFSRLVTKSTYPLQIQTVRVCRHNSGAGGPDRLTNRTFLCGWEYRQNSPFLIEENNVQIWNVYINNSLKDYWGTWNDIWNNDKESIFCFGIRIFSMEFGI